MTTPLAAIDDATTRQAQDGLPHPKAEHPPRPSRSARPAISCVVPAFNEAANLGLMLTALTGQLAQLTDRWEVIVIDDGSRDATPVAIAPFLIEPGVRYV